MTNRRRKALAEQRVRSIAAGWTGASPFARDDDQTSVEFRRDHGKWFRTVGKALNQAHAFEGTIVLFEKGVRPDGSGPRRETRLERWNSLLRSTE